MKKRVFVAIHISGSLQIKIEEWKRNFQKLPVRWIKKENLHVTLVPPWYVVEIDEVIDCLNSIKQDDALKPLTILFREIKFGPNPRRPRLIWVGGETTPEIKILKSKLEDVFGMKSKKREILIHLTIARFKVKDFYKFPIKNLNDKVFWQEKVSSFLLMESRLKRSGAEYEKLAEIPL